jgi:hypothetical protein
MSRLRIHNFSISLGGYGAGPGARGLELQQWMHATRKFREMNGQGMVASKRRG